MSLLAQSIPLSLYVHIPWCVQKCPYCDFNSHEFNSHEFNSHEFNSESSKDNFKKVEVDYIENLFIDLEQDLPKVWGRTVETVFIGGGTPSLFSGPAIEQLISGIRARLMLRACSEITLESNPGTADADNYLAYHQAGVNRLSIGVQSFDNEQLKKLGRIHDAQQAKDAFAMARAAGFQRINIDLMFALPDQSVEEALSDLRQAIELDPEHISWYQLTLEPNTNFYSYPPKHLPDDDKIWQIQEAGAELLRDAGFEQYEISAWCKKNEQCEHNVNYWQFGDYLGIGAGAHGKITDFNQQSIIRTRRRKQPHHWLSDDASKTKQANPKQSQYLAESKEIAKHDLALEFMMNTMRLNYGVPTMDFSERTGLLIADIAAPLRMAKQQKLMHDVSHRLCATSRGLNYLNDLLAIFMMDDDNSKVDKTKQAANIPFVEVR